MTSNSVVHNSDGFIGQLRSQLMIRSEPSKIAAAIAAVAKNITQQQSSRGRGHADRNIALCAEADAIVVRNTFTGNKAEMLAITNNYVKQQRLKTQQYTAASRAVLTVDGNINSPLRTITNSNRDTLLASSHNTRKKPLELRKHLLAPLLNATQPVPSLLTEISEYIENTLYLQLCEDVKQQLQLRFKNRGAESLFNTSECKQLLQDVQQQHVGEVISAFVRHLTTPAIHSLCPDSLQRKQQSLLSPAVTAYVSNHHQEWCGQQLSLSLYQLQQSIAASQHAVLFDVHQKLSATTKMRTNGQIKHMTEAMTGSRQKGGIMQRAVKAFLANAQLVADSDQTIKDKHQLIGKLMLQMQTIQHYIDHDKKRRKEEQENQVRGCNDLILLLTQRLLLL